MGFSRQEYWSGLSFPSPGDLPDPGIELSSPALIGGFFTTEPLGKPQASECSPKNGDRNRNNLTGHVLAIQNADHELITSTPPESLLEMQNLGPYPRSSEPEPAFLIRFRGDSYAC